MSVYTQLFHSSFTINQADDAAGIYIIMLQIYFVFTNIVGVFQHVFFLLLIFSLRN